jgi:hypothetical protein
VDAEDLFGGDLAIITDAKPLGGVLIVFIVSAGDLFWPGAK